LFGPAILANPVIEKAATRRTVYLPAGTRWTDFWTGESLDGGRRIEAEAPLQTMPLFVRAGSVVPLGPSLQYASERPADPVELRVYTGADGRFTLYEDAGDGYDYERGEYATIEMRWDERKQTLTIGPRQGRFPGLLEQRTFRVVWVGPRHGHGLQSSVVADAEVAYRGQPVAVRRTPSRP
jgi:alpha-D-xyloside xylohydrolase